MKIVYVLPQLPYPPHSGGRLVTYHLIKALSQHHQVWIYGLSHGNQDEVQAGIEHLEPFCAQVQAFPAAPRVSLATLARMSFTRTPYKVLRFFSPTLQQALRHTEQRVQPDVLHCENFYTAQYAHGSLAKVKLLYEENYEPSILQRRLERTKNLLLKGFFRLELARTIQYQIACAEWLDQVNMISHLDADKLKQVMDTHHRTALQAKVCAIPTGIDTTQYQRPEHIDFPEHWNPQVPNLVFTGTMNYDANIDAVEWFASEILPRVRQAHPTAHFWVVGHSPPARIQALATDPYVHVTGSVDDVKPYLWHASVFVIPLRIGGGIRLKLLEALAASAPVVSTAIGAEGLSVNQQFPWIQSDSSESFAVAINQVLDSTHEQTKRADEGLRWVRQHYDVRSFADRMLVQYQSLLDSH